MRKRNSGHMRRIRSLVVASTLTALIFSVSTYAWFVGMKTVNVSNFDVDIASSESLLLSLDGSRWSTSVNISKDTLDSVSYVNHKNSWGGNGLLPVSSIGEMDSSSSRLKLYEKASLTTTTGGYRIMSSWVDNHTTGVEKDGYVAFDLFVKNYSGAQYLPTLNEKDEEAIYLTPDSAVTVASTGVANTGIENSVRVAFAQIGRVSGSTDTSKSENVSKVTGITCTSTGTSETDVTGICRTAQIWEPNDLAHNSNAISWYSKSCLHRSGLDVTLSGSYDANTASVHCGTVADGGAYKNTYAIAKQIGSDMNVDVYDGEDYNGYTADVGEGKALLNVNYFTDTEKKLTGTNRPTFMTLAPNSITKIRVYIYLEGQDVDNYDLASIGKKIAVKFGLTKERFTQEDIGYNGPEIVTPTE